MPALYSAALFLSATIPLLFRSFLPRAFNAAHRFDISRKHRASRLYITRVAVAWRLGNFPVEKPLITDDYLLSQCSAR